MVGGGAGGGGGCVVVVVSGSKLSGGSVVVVVVVLVVEVDVVVDVVDFDVVTLSAVDESPPLKSTAEADTTAIAATRPVPTATRRTLTRIPHPSRCLMFGGNSARQTVALNEYADSWTNAYLERNARRCAVVTPRRMSSAASGPSPVCAR